MKRIFLCKHETRRLPFFALFLKPCQRLVKGNTLWKEHSALELTCQLCFLALLKTTCQWPHWNVFTKVSGGCALWTRYRNCPWNKSERSQEAWSPLPGQWAGRRRSEESITENQPPLTAEDGYWMEKKNKRCDRPRSLARLLFVYFCLRVSFPCLLSDKAAAT